MSSNKTNAVGLQAAENGFIYDFIEKNGTTHKMALVIQNDKRTEDNLVSILLLGTRKGMSDTIPIKLDGIYYYVHCGMVTYCPRNYLGRRVAQVSTDIINRIRKNIAWQLGLSNDLNDYKKLYERLLDKITDKEDK